MVVIEREAIEGKMLSFMLRHSNRFFIRKSIEEGILKDVKYENDSQRELISNQLEAEFKIDEVFIKGVRERFIENPKIRNAHSFIELRKEIKAEINYSQNEINTNKKQSIKEDMRLIIITVVLMILFEFIEPSVENFRDKSFSALKKLYAEEVQNTVVETKIDKSLIKNYRLVTANVLNVREKSNGESRLIGKLYFGQAVVVLKKEKQWTLVTTVAGEKDAQIQGWVFSRYIKPIAKHEGVGGAAKK